ncbi:MAG: cysteine synthase A [Defluviitaleaceae bacterium]|nr:cysteine synthase A [Defluviitaleaceae bacterium]
MATIAKSLTDLIGNTPMLELSNYNRKHGIEGKIIAKLEYFNPLGSVKDRAGYAMIKAAEESGKLTSDTVIIEPTSGNTGISLAFVAASRGYKLILTMPDTMSVERRNMLKALGAKLVLTDGAKGMKGAIAKAEEIQRTTPGSIILDQFSNPANPEMHRRTTALEIWNDTQGDIDIFISGVGTAGTITGVGEVLKQKKPEIEVIAVEPADSGVLSGFPPGPHKIQGIGAGFIPKNYNGHVIDDTFLVENEQAFACTRELAKTEGLLVGISSGAALFAATVTAKEPEYKGKTIVVVFPDTGERYLSTTVFNDFQVIRGGLSY